jgi:Tfp pilus assembly protein PilF
MDRIRELLQFAKEEPENPFNIYALALEYQNQDKEKASFYFNKLLEEHKNYLPTYYHAAAFYASEGNISLANKLYLDGIALAKRQNNQHAKKELDNAYLNFQLENE